ncbi:BppU family phage baseplate upper protein [Bacillus thuringiensis]|nr:BppU family phage baseplate upper protein [Bacillus thuringiensis]
MTRLFNLNLDLIYSYSFLQEPIEIRKDDRDTTTVEVTVTNKGKPFNLKGWKIVYECRLSNGSYVRDDGSKFRNIKVIDEAKGVFRYTFINEAISTVGKVTVAYFALEKADSTLQNPIDRVTTRDFKYKVISDAISGSSAAAHYVSELEKIIEEMKKASEEIDLDAILKKIKEIQDQIGKVDFVKRGGDTMTGNLTVPRLYAGNAERQANVGVGTDDVYLSNTVSKKYLQLKDDGTLSYSNIPVALSNVAQMKKITNDNGTQTISVSDPTKNILEEIVAKGAGMNTIYCVSGAQGNTPNNKSWRGISYLNSPTFGFVIAFDYQSKVFSNYYDNGNWKGWVEHTGASKVDFDSMTDPATYLNSVKVLTRIPTKQVINSKNMWLQGVNVNAGKSEVYAAYVDDNGTTLRVEIFDFNAKSKGQRTFATSQNSYTESLPYWYNASNQLHFLVRLTNDSKYHVLNFDAGTTTGPFQLQGRRTIAVQDGNRMITVKESSNGAITGMYIYDWLSVKNGQPKLLGEKNFETTSSKPEKTQGVAQLGGYTFLCQGEYLGHPHLTVIDNTGKIQNVFRYAKWSLANIINAKYPNAIPADKKDTWDYESEGGCVYNGKLVTTQVTSDWAYLFVHNSADGTPIACEPDSTQSASTGNSTEVSAFFVRTLGAQVNVGDWVLDVGTTPKFQQGGDIVEIKGGIWYFKKSGMYNVSAFTSIKGADQAAEHILKVQLIERTTTNVADTIELDGKANGYTNKWTRLSGQMDWYFNEGDKIKVVYHNGDAGGVESYENRITFKKL